MEDQQRGANALPQTEKRGPLEPRSPLSRFAGSDKGADKAKSAAAQAARPQRRVMKDDERLRWIGSPRLTIERYPTQTKVYLDKPVWGLGTAEMLFLGSGTRSAERYATVLFAKLIEMADARRTYQKGRKARNAAGREVSRMLGRWGLDR